MNLYDIENEKAWSKEIKKRQMLYPNEKIVSFLAKNFSDFEMNNSKRALDVGFGSGRHLQLLMEYGIQSYGIDYSKASKEECLKILEKHSLLRDLKVESLESCQFADNYFDVIVCYGLIFLRLEKEMKSDLKKIYSMLKTNGKMIINFRTKEDFLFQKGSNVEGNSYILDRSNPTYENMLYTFVDKNEAESMLKAVGFKIENVEREDYWKNNMTEHHSWWIFTVRKG